MSGLDAAALLAAWEAAGTQDAVQRALTLLAAAMPGRSAADWAMVAIGERDRQLLAVRERLFGQRIEAVSACPACAEQLEVAFTTTDVALPAASGAPVQVEVDGQCVTCRLPDSVDLAAVADAPPGQARALLLERCTGADPSALPAHVCDAIERALQDADPQADIRIALQCPACGHGWAMAFDVLAYLWSEIDDWARHLLRDVHDLASAYGWREPDILALSQARRRGYLDMIADVT